MPKLEPDLFTLPRRKIEPAPLPSRPVPLPDDLVCSLRLLADAELERLRAAVINEVARRGLLCSNPSKAARQILREVLREAQAVDPVLRDAMLASSFKPIGDRLTA